MKKSSLNKKILKAIMLYFLISSILSCAINEDNSGLVEDNNLVHYATGTIKKYGNIDEGDCGFIIEISDTLYKPVNLTSEYETVNIAFKIKYKLFDSIFICGEISKPPYHRELKKIKILEIGVE